MGLKENGFNSGVVSLSKSKTSKMDCKYGLKNELVFISVWSFKLDPTVFP